jgi:5-formyltetrahydrofolate cyclo-ligase
LHGTGHDSLGGPRSSVVPSEPEPSPAGAVSPVGLTVPNSSGTNHTESAERWACAASVPDAVFVGHTLGEAKAELRARILAVRRAMPADLRAAAGRQLRDAVLGLPELQMAGTVAAYMAVGTEPATQGLIFALWKRGAYVLLPVLLPGGDLDWATYEGPDSLVPGPRGLLQPASDRRGVTAICSADLVVVPALAVDRAGRRLGRGGGSYDRALARIGPAILTIAPLYDGELLDEVPAGVHDQPIRAVALPSHGISRLR